MASFPRGVERRLLFYQEKAMRLRGKHCFARRMPAAAALFVALFIACQTSVSSVNLDSVSEAENFEWRAVADGFWETAFSAGGRNAACYAVRIDLSTAGLEITERTALRSRGFWLRDFAAEEGTAAAINTTPYRNVQGVLTPVGIIKRGGVVISRADSRYSALCFYNDEGALRAEIIDSQDENILSRYPDAFGGFFVTMRDGVILPFENNTRSRQGVGIDSEGRILYILTVISRGSLTDTNGLTYEECSRILCAMGARDAMQFDGGHSTALCVQGKTRAHPFMQRKIPAALGFRISGE